MANIDRFTQFQNILGEKADVAFFPISTDLQYLTGIPRDIPNYGRTIHPGEWLQGAWVSSKHDPILTLPRMTAKFGGFDTMDSIDLRVLGDWDDPFEMVKKILIDLQVPDKARIAISDSTTGETIIHLQSIKPEAKFSSATDLLRPMRVIKSQDDIDQMKEGGRITEAAFAATLTQLKLGMTELDLVEEVNYQLRNHGSLGQSFTTSFYNSAPNHPLIFGGRLETWQRKLNPPVSILFDFGAIYNGWCYDYGRTVFFGEPNEEAINVYNLIMASQAAGVAALKAGQVTTSEVDAAARKIIEDGGYGEEFRHRLGHAIGMDVHEPPFLTKGDETPVEEGMMFTIEPSITQFHNFSARVEDVVVARPTGGEKLTNGWQELIVVD